MEIKHETLVFNLPVVHGYAWRGAALVCRMDIRPGSIRILMTGPDGSEQPMGGYFREMGEHLVFTPVTCWTQRLDRLEALLSAL